VKKPPLPPHQIFFSSFLAAPLPVIFILPYSLPLPTQDSPSPPLFPRSSLINRPKTNNSHESASPSQTTPTVSTSPKTITHYSASSPAADPHFSLPSLSRQHRRLHHRPLEPAVLIEGPAAPPDPCHLPLSADHRPSSPGQRTGLTTAAGHGPTASTSRPARTQRRSQTWIRPPSSSSSSCTAPSTDSPATNSCRPDKTQRSAALWSHRRPIKTENKGKRKENRDAKKEADLQNKRIKINCCCALFPLLQVTVTFTAGVGRQRRGRRPRSTGSATFIGGGAWIHAPPVTVVRGKKRRHCSCCSRRASLQFLEF